MKPTFILGVGAQKAGTSWLYQTLKNQNCCNMGFRKEYHVWDAKLSELGKHFVVPLKEARNREAIMRKLMQKSDLVYISYFKWLVNEKTTITGDITPSYAYLDAKAFSHIKALLEKHSFDVKVIFIMRDPVERMWSMLRMNKRHAAKKGIIVGDLELQQQMLGCCDDKQAFARTNYISTIKNLEAVFPQSSIHYKIYEDLFNYASLEKLQTFLGFPLEGVDFEKRVNVSSSASLPSDIRAKVKKQLIEQYEFCNKRFPKTKKLWVD